MFTLSSFSTLSGRSCSAFRCHQGSAWTHPAVDTYWESEPITIGLVLGLATLTYLFHPAPSNLILVWSAGLGRIYLYRYTPVALVKASLSRAVHSVCVCCSEDLITDPHTHAKAKATYGGPQSPVNSYRSQANSHCGGLD